MGARTPLRQVNLIAPNHGQRSILLEDHAQRVAAAQGNRNACGLANEAVSSRHSSFSLLRAGLALVMAFALAMFHH
jgi:hypothetical protein